MYDTNGEFVQMRKGSCAGMWIYVRRINGKTEYFHSDRQWRTHAGDGTGYFNSKEEIELILDQ